MNEIEDEAVLAAPPDSADAGRKRARRMRCHVCDKKWSYADFCAKRSEFDRVNPERGPRHRIELNEQQREHLRSFFTPTGELSVLCSVHLRRYASIGSKMVAEIRRSAMDVAMFGGAADAMRANGSVAQQRHEGRGGYNKIERRKPDVVPFLREWVADNTVQNPGTLEYEFGAGLTSKGVAYRRFSDELLARHRCVVSWPSFLRLLRDYAPEVR